MTEVATMPETEIEPPAPESSSEAAAAVEPPEIPAENAVAPTTEKVGSKPYDTDAHLHEIEHAEQLVAAREGEWEALKSETKGAKDAFDAAVERLRRIIRGGDAPLFSQGNAAVKEEAAPVEAPVPERKPLEWKDGSDEDSHIAENSCGIQHEGIVCTWYIDKQSDDEGGQYVIAHENVLTDAATTEQRFETLADAMAYCEAADAKLWAEHNPASAKTCASMPNPNQPADDSWKSTILADLKPAIPPGKLKILLEHEKMIVTLGDLAEFQKKEGDWWVKRITGLGAGGAKSIEDACMTFWSEHPEFTGAK